MYYGFDIGGTKIELVAFDSHFKACKRERRITPSRDYEGLLATILSMVEAYDAHFQTTGKVGIGFPGFQNKKDDTFIAANIPCVSGQLFLQDLTKLLGREVRIGNDCQCFALSEAVMGAGRGYGQVFGAIIGTGAGGGFVSRGQLMRGGHGYSGEWGHIGVSAEVIDKHALPIFNCGCGLKGCYEQYVSGSGLANIYQHKVSALGGDTKVKKEAKEIVLLAQNSDQLAEESLTVYIDILGAALATLQLTFDPDAIILGGGMSNVTRLYSEVSEKLKFYLFDHAEPAQILAPEYGDSSGVLGAALLHK